jgi:hypothetical protein
MTDLMPEQLVDLDQVLGDEPAAPASGSLDAVDEQLVARLVGCAREGRLQLTGEGGLLAQFTKRLVESALEGEITDHLGYDRHDPAGRDGGNSRSGHRRAGPRHGRSRCDRSRPPAGRVCARSAPPSRPRRSSPGARTTPPGRPYRRSDPRLVTTLRAEHAGQRPATRRIKRRCYNSGLGVTTSASG